MKSALHQTTAQGHPLPAIGTIHLIPVSMLHPMPCSPFKIRDDDAMQELAASMEETAASSEEISAMSQNVGEAVNNIAARSRMYTT